MTTRRRFPGALLGGVLATPSAARAPALAKIPRIGYLAISAVQSPEAAHMVKDTETAPRAPGVQLRLVTVRSWPFR